MPNTPATPESRSFLGQSSEPPSCRESKGHHVHSALVKMTPPFWGLHFPGAPSPFFGICTFAVLCPRRKATFLQKDYGRAKVQGDAACQDLCDTVDGRNPAPPKKPWNDDFPVETKQTVGSSGFKVVRNEFRPSTWIPVAPIGHQPFSWSYRAVGFFETQGNGFDGRTWTSGKRTGEFYPLASALTLGGP